ncbi:MAG: hypothetical protein WBK46_02715 [Ruminococcus flavefaciens]
MDILDKLKGMTGRKKFSSAIAVLGTAGLLLIMISSLLPEKAGEGTVTASGDILSEAETYCTDTEKRLASFLSRIDGAGEVKVYLSVGSNEWYIYASEEKHSRSDGRVEEEEKYVMTGSGSEKKALVETVRTPEICSAVIAASGCDSAAVQERLHKAASAALDIPTGKVYVTKLG